MHHLTLILALAASFQKALSFAGTSPVVAWSSHRYSNSNINPLQTVPPPPSSDFIDHFVFVRIYIFLRCSALDRLRPGTVSTGSIPFLNDVSTKLLSDTDVCEFDAVIIVDHPGVSPNMSLPPYRPERPCLFHLCMLFTVTRVRPALTLPILIPRNPPPRLSIIHTTSLRALPTLKLPHKLQPSPRSCR